MQFMFSFRPLFAWTPPRQWIGVTATLGAKVKTIAVGVLDALDPGTLEICPASANAMECGLFPGIRCLGW